MKDFIIRLAILMFVFVVIPYLLINIMSDTPKNEIVTVYNHQTKKILRMTVNDYLIGVVAAEMPAEFSKEALKAQTVAARTYMLKRRGNNFEEHFGADMCTDYSHCQAYVDFNELKNKWGKNYKKHYRKIKECVISTHNECLLYNGEYATAVFHSCSNGKTENAADVWGGKVDYLVCVESEGDYNKKDYLTKQTYSFEEFNNILSSNGIRKCYPNADKPIVTDIIMTQGDNVGSAKIYDTIFTGTEIRKIFSLKSSAFDIDINDGYVNFSVYGNGHGVGMSQYGAQYMAENGKEYSEILYHYYPGTNIANV